MVEVWTDAETFSYNKGEVGCLLLHGGTGTPAVMRPMGQFFSESNISALGARLKGFGTSPENWLKTTHLDWILSAEKALETLKEECKTIFIAGLSMGGTLALYLAYKHQNNIDGVISICSPAGPSFLKNFTERFLPLVKENRPQPNFSATDIKDENVKPGGYDCHYPSLNLEWAKVVEKANLGLPSILCPALIIEAKNDHVVDPKTAEWIFQNIGSKQKELCWLDNSYHMATIDVDKEIVFKRAIKFISAFSN